MSKEGPASFWVGSTTAMRSKKKIIDEAINFHQLQFMFVCGC